MPKLDTTYLTFLPFHITPYKTINLSQPQSRSHNDSLTTEHIENPAKTEMPDQKTCHAKMPLKKPCHNKNADQNALPIHHAQLNLGM